MAVADEKHLIYSDFELKRDGYIYTADTLALLCEKHPENEYYFIIGGDSLHTLDTWYHPEIILQHAVILASGRDNIRQDEVELEILRLKGIYPDAGYPESTASTDSVFFHDDTGICCTT